MRPSAVDRLVAAPPGERASGALEDRLTELVIIEARAVLYAVELGHRMDPSRNLLRPVVTGGMGRGVETLNNIAGLNAESAKRTAVQACDHQRAGDFERGEPPLGDIGPEDVALFRIA